MCKKDWPYRLAMGTTGLALCWAVLFTRQTVAMGARAQELAGRAAIRQESDSQSLETEPTSAPDPVRDRQAGDGSVTLLDEQGTCQFLSRQGGPLDWPCEDGIFTSTPDGHHSNHLVSDLHFQDAEIQVEFRVPMDTAGNSGVYLHGCYELQIIDSYGKEAVTEQDVGSLYGFAPAKVNAALPRGEWQRYRIRYRAPRRDEAGRIVEEGEVSAWLNGQLVQDRTRFGEPKSSFRPFLYRTNDYLRSLAEEYRQTQVGPLFLQDHGNPVQFRNIWIRPLNDRFHSSTERRAANLTASVEELRESVGEWNVVTELFNEDGSAAGNVTGTYRFEWVIEDRVLRGLAETPALNRKSAILFYVNEISQQIEMVSVGADGKRWTMTGPLGGTTRTSQEFDRDDGAKCQLRFTRYNVTDDGFESKMELTLDGGKTWLPGNHQTFTKRQ